jgi:hypothetical protein
MLRLVDQCPSRSNTRNIDGTELADCELGARRFAAFGRAVRVARDVCEQCCRTSPPGPARLNEVVSSLLYREASQILDSPGLLPEEARIAADVRREALEHLKVVWTTPNHVEWAGPVHGPRTTAELIDTVVNPDTFAGHLRDGEPFAYLRYNDGEWLSILGHRGRNADEHDFFPETLGPDLRLSLDYLAGLWPENDRLYAGLHAVFFQDAIRRHLVEHEIINRIRWVGDNLFAQGLYDFSTYRFLQAIKAYEGPKVLVANGTLSPVAAGLGCRHVVIARENCYLNFDRIRSACAFRGPGLLICCAGMTSECLIHRAHEDNPQGSYVDCGHIFDALVGIRSREYTRDNGDGILQLLDEHYAPLVFEHPTRQGLSP